MSSGNIIQVVTNETGNKKMKCEKNDCLKIKGNVVLMKKQTASLGINDPQALLHDIFDEFMGQRVSLQLISATNGDPEDEDRGKLGRPAYLEKWNTFGSLNGSEINFQITFDWEEEIRDPGAFTIRNNHHSQFYLKTLTLEDVPAYGRLHFVCNSWIYPAKHYEKDRVFFSNKTPMPLRKYREEELENLRGDGKGKLQEADRVYDYACYNDLGDPDGDLKHARPVLGGSTEYPYPRRARTGREPTKSDPYCESRLPPHMSLNTYVPRDEQFSHTKKKEFIVTSLKSLAQLIGPELEAIFDTEFECHRDILTLYEGVKVPDGPLHDAVDNNNPLDMFKAIFRSDQGSLFKFPMPDVIKEDKSAWMSDEEFAREMLAGVNPVNIRRLEEFPPKSRLNHKQYGNQNSSMKKENIVENLNKMSIDEAIEKNKLFILDYHDVLMPYLRRINTSSKKIYASRTLLFLKEDGTLKPLAIELSLPHPAGDQLGAVSNVYTPAAGGIEGSIWQLAKAYVAVNDSGFHQLISHWLNTHAVIEPFVIATNRQLSVLHPVYKLLHPHFRDTLFINALARQVLVNAEGVLESTVFPGQYSMELSSAVYKEWNFTDQALPEDLKKRGMAVENENPDSPCGLNLMIEDYPYAVDGLEIWSAIKKWVKGYCSLYYKTNEMVRCDSELQSWWKEVQEEGHGDKKGKLWWPRMQTCEELIETCSTIIWIASALHAAINFGQYPYGGYLPNRPTISRRLMPEKGSAEYEELKSHPEKAFFKTITAKPQALLGISLVEILSSHSSDEEYLDQRTPEWTSDMEALEAFKKFQDTLKEVGDKILERNRNSELKNRVGPINMPYTLLFPTSEEGLTGQGIPNSVSI